MPCTEWVTSLASLDPGPPPKCIDWMRKTGNLGGALRQVCGVLDLKLIEQALGSPLSDEAQVLGLDDGERAPDPCFVRSIFLVGDGVPLTFGRVVVPQCVYEKHAEGFGSLGTRLIGEALLYRSSATVRRAFEFKNIGVRHPVYDFLRRHLPATYAFPDFFPARRSVFLLEGSDPLLIMEVFLNDLPETGKQEGI